MKILVIGCGSIGKRHIRNLKSISKNIEIFSFDKKKENLKLVEEKYKAVPITNLSETISKEKFHGALICTPPSSHIEFAKKLIKYNIPLFIEKPLSHNFQRIDNFAREIKRKKIPILVGYNLHFHPGVILVKQLIKKNKIGNILSVRIDAGQHLPDWHPKENYRKMYTARKDLGGGIILDGSHEIDYLLWLLENARPKEIFCFADKISNLDVETEDTAEILLKFHTGVIANIHLDFTQRVYSRSCKLIGENGTIVWDYPKNQVELYLANKKKWQIFNLNFIANEMYIKEMKHFLRVIQKKERPKVTLWEGIDVLKIALMAKKSTTSGKKILL